MLFASSWVKIMLPDRLATPLALLLSPHTRPQRRYNRSDHPLPYPLLRSLVVARLAPG